MLDTCHKDGGLIYMQVGILIQLHLIMSTSNMYILVVIGIMLNLSSYIDLVWFTRLLASLSQHRWRFDYMSCLGTYTLSSSRYNETDVIIFSVDFYSRKEVGATSILSFRQIRPESYPVTASKISNKI